MGGSEYSSSTSEEDEDAVTDDDMGVTPYDMGSDSDPIDVKKLLARVKKTQKALDGRRRAAVRKRRTIEEGLYSKVAVVPSTAKAKWTFTLSIIAVLVVQSVIMLRPVRLVHAYLFLIFPLLGWRYLSYTHGKMSLFMLDYCYITNWTLVFWLLFSKSMLAPETRRLLFQGLYSACSGPILAAIPFWGNTFAPSDLDKMTSLFIHAMPALVVYVLRFFGTDLDRSFLDTVSSEQLYADGVCSTPECSWSWVELVGWPMVGWLAWAVVYTLNVEFWSRRRLEAHPEAQYSRRWLTKTMASDKRSFWYKVAYFAGDGHYQLSLMYMVTQGVYTLVFHAPVALFVMFPSLHSAALLLSFFAALQNGAHFQMKKFPRQATRLLEKERAEKEKRIQRLRGEKQQ